MIDEDKLIHAYKIHKYLMSLQEWRRHKWSNSEENSDGYVKSVTSTSRDSGRFSGETEQRRKRVNKQKLHKHSTKQEKKTNEEFNSHHSIDQMTTTSLGQGKENDDSVFIDKYHATDEHFVNIEENEDIDKRKNIRIQQSSNTDIDDDLLRERPEVIYTKQNSSWSELTFKNLEKSSESSSNDKNVDKQSEYSILTLNDKPEKTSNHSSTPSTNDNVKCIQSNKCHANIIRLETSTSAINDIPIFRSYASKQTECEMEDGNCSYQIRMPSWKNVGEIKEQMFKCCVNNSIEDFRLLLQNYVNFLDKNSENFIPFDTMNDEGLSFLQVACQSGSFEIVSVLLNEMEKVMETLYDLIYEFITNENEMSNNRLDIPHNDNRLVLSRNNSISSNRNIIRSNLNVSKKTTETSSLYLSKNEKTKNIFRRMFFQQIINKQHSLTRRTSLHYAIFSSKRNEEIIEKLLNFYGNCRLQDLTGNTPLHLLCKDKNNPHLKKEAIQKIFHMFSSTDMSQTTENSMVLNRKELILKNSIISNYNSVIKQMSNIYSYLSFREDDQLYTPFNLFEIKNKDDDNIFCTAVKFNNIQIINLILQKIVNEISFPSTTNHQEFTETNSDDTTPIIPHVIQDIRQRMATKKRREISSIREKWRYANTVISGWKNKQLFTFLHRLSFLERAHHQNFLTIDLYIYLLYNNRLNTIFTILDKFSFRFNELIVQNDIDIKSFPNIGKVIKKNSSQDLFEDANGLKQFFSISETVPRGKGKKKNFYKFFEKSSSKINGSILPTKINDDVDDTDDDNIAIEINTLNDVLSGRNSSIINQLHENKKETYSNFHYSMISGMNMNDLRTVHDSLTNHLKLAAIFDPQDKTATQRQLMSSMMVTCFDTYWCLQGQCQMKKKDYSHQSIMNGLEAIAPLISLSEWQFLCINIFLFDALYVQQIYRSEYLFQNNILDVKFPSSLSIDNKSIGEKKKSKTISFRLKSRKKWKRKSIRLNLVRSFNCLHSYPSTIASTRDCHRTKNIIKNCLIRSVIIWLNTTSESVDIRKTIMDALHLAKLYDAEKVFASISLSR